MNEYAGLAPLKIEGVSITDGVTYLNPGDDGYDEAAHCAQRGIAGVATPDYADCAQRSIAGLAAEIAAEMEANAAGEDLVRINDSGIIPTEFKVLVLPDESEVELRARRSGLVVPDEAAGTYRHAAVTGRIIALSPAAFSYHDWPDGVRLPGVGDRVVYARYAGMRVNGRPRANEKGHEEQTEYRLLNDKDIAGVLDY